MRDARRSVRLLVAAAGIVAAACTDPVERDRTALERVVQADEAFDRAMKEADDASRAGRDPQAADLLRDKARPAADAALAAAKGAAVETEWGRARKRELVTLVGDRAAEVPAYEEALRSADPAKKLAALERQIALQKRALEAAAAVRKGK
jgi:hypothetical protein